MARKLGEAPFGVFTFAFALVAIATTAANLGQDTIMTREVARDQTRLRAYFGDAVASKLALALPAFAIAIAVVVAFGGDRETVAVTALLAAAALTDLVTMSCFAVFQALDRFAAIAAALVAQRVLTAALGLAALALGAAVETVSVAFVAGSVAALVVAGVRLRPHVGRRDIDVEPSRWRTLMRAALPIGLTGIFATVLFRVDVALLAALESDEVVGEYGAAYRLFEATLFVSWSIGAAAYPVFSRLSRASEPPIRDVLEIAWKLILVATLPLAAAGVVFGERLAVLAYGDAYEDSGTALRILAPTIALFGLAYVAGYLLVAQDRQRVWSVVYGIVAVVNIAANVVLIPHFSLYAAAAVTTASELVVAAALGAVAVGITGGMAWGRTFLGPVLATAVAVAVALALEDAFLAALVAAAVTYGVVLVAFERVVFPEDTAALFALVRRRPAFPGASADQGPGVG